MKHRGGWSEAERRIRSRLHALLGEAGFLRGSLLVIKRRCGNPNCRCAQGRRHRSLVIEQHRRGRTRMRTVRAEEREKVEQWVKAFREAKGLLEELSELHWEKLAKLKRKRKK